MARMHPKKFMVTDTLNEDIMDRPYPHGVCMVNERQQCVYKFVKGILMC